MKKTIFFLLLCCISIALRAQEYTIKSIPNVQLQNSRAFVSNPDGILSAQTVATLDSMLYNLRQTNTSEFIVVAVNSIGDNDPVMFANELFAHWGIGRKEKDNGLLLLFVLDQRRATTEVGYGLEGILTDGLNKRLMRKYMLPYFKQGNYDQGMIEGVKAFIAQMTTDEANRELYAETPKDEWTAEDTYMILFLYFLASAIIAAFFIGWIMLTRKNNKDKESYYLYKEIIRTKIPIVACCFLFPLFLVPLLLWLNNRLKALRNKPVSCPECHGAMHKLSEEEEDVHLTQAEQTEERIRSIDYDVWLCDKCQKVKIFPYESQYTNYKRCPMCHAKAYSLQSDKVLIEPTPFSKGTGEKTYYCQNCQKTQSLKYIIPMIIVASGGGGGRNGGGGGGFSGGGFGGGRSGGGGGSIGW